MMSERRPTFDKVVCNTSGDWQETVPASQASHILHGELFLLSSCIRVYKEGAGSTHTPFYYILLLSIYCMCFYLPICVIHSSCKLVAITLYIIWSSLFFPHALLLFTNYEVSTFFLVNSGISKITFVTICIQLFIYTINHTTCYNIF